MKLKNVLFILTFIGLNVAAIVLLELFLMLFGVGHPNGFFIKESLKGVKYLYPNKQFAAQFVPGLNTAVPVCPPFYIQEKKENGVFRIFVVGESTSQGFPYSKTEAFPYQLGQMLDFANTGKRIEVVNFSMSAINSHIGRKILSEVVRLQPDLVVLYFGHNEFIGFGGAGEFNKTGYKLSVFLTRFRIYQMLKVLAGNISGKPKVELLAEMARKNVISNTSPVYQQTIDDFASNYSAMLSQLKRMGIPAVACAAARNLADYPPHIDNALSTDQEFALADTVLKVKTKMDEALEPMVGNDPAKAYYVGNFLLDQRQPDSAYKYLELACDFDPLHMRAPKAVNQIISNLASQYGAFFLDTQTLLDRQSPQTIAGNGQFAEHVHPLLESHTKIAEALAGNILTNLFHIDAPARYNITLFSTLADKVSTAGILAGLYNGFPLKDLGYFNPAGIQVVYDFITNSTIPGDFRFIPRKDVDGKAVDFITSLFKNNVPLDEIHNKLGIILANSNETLPQAFQEFLIAYEQNPLNRNAMNNLAVLCHVNSQDRESELLFSRLKARKFMHSTFLNNLYSYYNTQGRLLEAEEVKKMILKKGEKLQENNPVSLINE